MQPWYSPAGGLAPKYLFYIDNINFALAVQQFQPAWHQPHPPGDPLFVVLLKAIHLLFTDMKYVELMAGTIGSCIALLTIYLLGNEVFERLAGTFAVAILFFLPAFWLAGIANPVRTFIAAGSGWLALCVWRAIQSPQTLARFALAGFSLGLAAGFRPELLVLLFPLLCFPLLLAPRKPPAALTALSVLTLTSASWFAVLVWKIGGPAELLHLFQMQWQSSAAHTAIWAAVAQPSARDTPILTTYWVGVGTLCWIGALPALAYLSRRMPGVTWYRDRRTAFLAVWFPPPYLFHALIFIHDPDTALIA